MGYEIKVLQSDEFDSLPYEGISDSLGFADVKSGKVFVRQTGSHELNRYLINHEIDHLVEDHATDEDKNGIRHKKFSDVLRHFYNPLNIGGMGPLSDSNKGFLDTAVKDKPENVMANQQNAMAQPPQAQNPFGQFSVSGQTGTGSTPPGLDNSVGGTLNKGGLNGGSSSQQSISPDILERIKGYYSGRIPF